MEKAVAGKKLSRLVWVAKRNAHSGGTEHVLDLSDEIVLTYLSALAEAVRKVESCV